MNDTLMKIQKNGWNWSIKDPLLLDTWLENITDTKNKNLVKSNVNRDVFRLKRGNNVYYVKHYHSSGKGRSLISYFLPKAKAEYMSSKILSDYGIKTAAIAGWGAKKNQSMLITEELSGFVDAKKFWFLNASETDCLKVGFVKNLSVLLSKFISSKIFHPDFHLGNLLVNPDTFEMAVVDTHGVKLTGRYDRSKLIKILSVFGAMRGEISDDEAEHILKNIFTLQDFPVSDIFTRELWKDILIHESAETEKLWKKRRRQILIQNNKYVNRTEIDGDTWLIRRNILGIDSIDSGEIRRILKQSPDMLMQLTSSQAERIWLKSFRLEFHRIRHIMPVAWLSKKKNSDFIVYLQNSDKCKPAKGRILAEFIKRCERAGFQIIDENKCFLHENKVLCKIDNIN